MSFLQALLGAVMFWLSTSLAKPPSS